MIMSASAIDGARVLKGGASAIDKGGATTARVLKGGSSGEWEWEDDGEPDWETIISDVCSNAVDPPSCVSSLSKQGEDLSRLSLVALDLASQEARVASRYIEDLKRRSEGEPQREGAFEWCSELMKRSRYEIHDSHKDLLNLISYNHSHTHHSHHDHIFRDTVSRVVGRLTAVQDNHLLCQGRLSLRTSSATTVYYGTLHFTDSVADALAIFIALSHRRHF
jgi:pectinesterase inhibitor-like protein